jgi:hypothetical protein
VRLIGIVVIWIVTTALLICGTWFMLFLVTLAGLAVLHRVGIVGQQSDNAHLAIASIVWLVWALACTRVLRRASHP